MIYRNLKIVASILVIGATLSCNRDVVFEEIKPIQNREWHFDSALVFEFDIEDGSKTYNAFLGLRNGTAYPYANIHVIMDWETPKLTFRDTTEFFLADPYGQWLGSGSGDMVDNSIQFRRNWKLKSGHYKVTMRHAMRDDVLTNVHDVGLKVTKGK